MRHRHDGESRRQTATPPTLDRRDSPRHYKDFGLVGTGTNGGFVEFLLAG